MANKIAIVTDSTAYIPEALNRQYNIHVVPQVLIWEQKTYRDGVDIKPAEFYQRQLGALQHMAVTDYCEVVDRRAACH